MTQFHTTLSRRDFMKGLGVVGAGVGVGAVIPPAFNDVDEITSAPSAITRKPWWVKLQDKPTVPVDMNTLKEGRTRSICLERAPGYASPPEGAETNQKFIDYYKREWGEWDPGPNCQGMGDFPFLNNQHVGSVRDNALMAALQINLFGQFPPEVVKATGGKFHILHDKPAGWRLAPPVEQRGGTKWQGTPEENLRTVRAAARFFGADDVGAIEVDDNFRKVMWGSSIDLLPAFFRGEIKQYKLEWGDVNDFVLTPGPVEPSNIVIPNRCRYFVHWTMRQPPSRMRHDCGTIQGPSQAWTYSHNAQIGKNIQEFLWGLGYIALDNWMGYIIPTGYTGVMAGAGELSRWSAVLTPKFGATTRAMYGFLTDLPLAETKPVNFGAYEFCHTCGICADKCPMEAIQKGEPSWDAPEAWQNPGYLGWRLDLTRCTHCPVCMSVCPFSSLDNSFVHTLVRGTSTTTTLFNSFFASMDRTFGYGRKPPEDWWERDQTEPTFGIDSTL